MKTKIFFAVTLILFLAPTLQACDKHKNENVQPPPTHDHGQTAMYYCPMHPNYTSDKPGQCPICGMNLVPMENKKDETKKSDDGAGVTIPLEKQQLIGVKTTVLKKQDATKEIRTLGRVAFNPELAIAQTEYLEAKKTGDKSLVKASAERLTLLGMNKESIAGLKEIQKNLYLPSKKSWIYPIVYENELPLLKTGQTVDIVLKNGAGLKGTVRSIDSVIDPQTRSARLHVEVDNNGLDISPDMYGTATIKIGLGEKLVVPKSAVISTGERNVAFMVHDGTHFMPMDVKLGAELKDDYVVDAGLEEGDTVVISATFLVDSESKLKSALQGSGHKH
jgi:Cu(I)/Ag(I) efflux system membrane fusion protein